MIDCSGRTVRDAGRNLSEDEQQLCGSGMVVVREVMKRYYLRRRLMKRHAE